MLNMSVHFYMRLHGSLFSPISHRYHFFAVLSSFCFAAEQAGWALTEKTERATHGEHRLGGEWEDFAAVVGNNCTECFQQRTRRSAQCRPIGPVFLTFLTYTWRRKFHIFTKSVLMELIPFITFQPVMVRPTTSAFNRL